MSLGQSDLATDSSTSLHSPQHPQLFAALQSAAGWLVDNQEESGYWCGELEGDTILESEYIILLGWLGRERSEVAAKAAKYLLKQQLSSGGWALYPGGPLELSASVKAYLALKLTGYSPELEAMRRARAAICTSGGADRVNSFTRFYLALLGQISYDQCPAVPPEMVLVPSWAPVNIYRISAWSRTILVPLSVMWAHRPVRKLSDEMGIAELFLSPPEKWPPLRCPRPSDARRAPIGRRVQVAAWETFFRVTDAAIKQCERWRFRPLRPRALAAARDWMLERFEDSDGLAAIFPPIIWSIVALRCLGYADDSPEVAECHRQLEGLAIEENETIRLQPCKSPVWDTALSVRALSATIRVTPRQDVTRAIDQANHWLLSKEVRRAGDWSVATSAEPSGWFFEHRNAFYPDIDDTTMVLMALQEASGAAGHGNGDDASETERRVPSESEGDACRRGLDWIVAMQNRDGGWGAFDRDNDHEFLCHVPFADHNAMIDPSTPDITARVLEALAQFRLTRDSAVIDRGLSYLLKTQDSDGSWFGRWGVNHIYGTWQVLTGMAAVGVPSSDRSIRRGVEWFVSHQQDDGGWGESPASYEDPTKRGRGPVTPSQTAWAVLGLLAAGGQSLPAVSAGVEHLLATQQPNGTWHEPEFTGTGFPLVFYLRYHLYPVYFPVLALAQFARQSGSGGIGNGMTES
jgi:squalene-hopene/tetraprenyl-beta-curcumene cyclase